MEIGTSVVEEEGIWVDVFVGDSVDVAEVLVGYVVDSVVEVDVLEEVVVGLTVDVVIDVDVVGLVEDDAEVDVERDEEVDSVFVEVGVGLIVVVFVCGVVGSDDVSEVEEVSVVTFGEVDGGVKSVDVAGGVRFEFLSSLLAGIELNVLF